jgi:hypothetical protein
MKIPIKVFAIFFKNWMGPIKRKYDVLNGSSMGLPNLNRPIFHKTFDVLLFKCHGIHVCNMFFVDNTPYKSLFNEPFNVIFL